MEFYKTLVPQIEVLATFGRTINLEKTARYGKLSQEYLENAAICLIHPNDLKKLGIKEGNVKITTKTGSVVVKAVTSEFETSEGIIVLPNSPWVNKIFAEKDFQQNQQWFRAIIEITKEEIVPIDKIIEELSEGN